MADRTSSSGSAPLLMQPKAGTDPAEAFRRARARRRAAAPSPLVAALAREEAEPDTRSGQAQPESAAEQAIADLQAAMETYDAGEAPGGTREQGRDSLFVPRADNGVLIDPAILFSEIWRKRWLIAGTTLAGAAIGLLMALNAQSRYTAFSQVMIDPREVKLVERDLAPEFLANESALAIIDSRLSLVTSRQVLEKVIERTNLDQDSEFNGRDRVTGPLTILRELVSPDNAADSAGRITVQNLREAITTDRTSRTFVVNVGVSARSPEKAALLANEVTRAFVEEQSAIKSLTAGEANEALTGRLASLKAAVETAEKAVDDFRLANGLEQAQGRLLADERLATASAQLNEARAATIRARAKADGAASADIDAVIAGSLPIDLNTPALTTFRAQHSSLRQQEAALEQQLGPRHPRLANIRASVGAARQDIALELRRIVEGAQGELRRAVEAEQELAAEVARAKAEIANKSDPLVTLRDLEAKAEAARAFYQGALLRARETGELEQLATVNASVLSAAEPPSDPSSISKKTILAGWTIGGLLAGLAIAGLFGLARGIGIGAGTPHAPAPARPAPSGPEGRRRDEQPNPSPRTEQPAMYPGYPYPPQTAMQQPLPVQPQQPGWWTQPAPAPQGYYPAAPMPVAMPAGAPWAGAHWPQPAPMPPMAGYGMPQPMPQAVPQAWPQPMPQAWPQAQADAAHAAALAAEDRREMADLRQSLSDIREVVDALLARRDSRRRFG